MLLDIKRVLEAQNEPACARASFDLSGEDFPGYEVPRAVEAQITATPAGGAVDVSLSARAEVSFACARCLRECTRLFPVEAVYRVRREDFGDEFPELPITADGKLDVRELVYTELVLSIPSVLLCSEDCAGLCSVCGRRKPCSCRHETSGSPDPRLARLKELLDERALP